MPADFIVPDWPAPPHIHALVTTRAGGVSTGPYASFNLADHVGDDPEAVAENRHRLRAFLPTEPVWLEQVHGTRCIDAASVAVGCEADAAYSRIPGVVCAVLTADCLPVLLCDEAGTVVAAAHAGWRGLAAGVIEATVAAMNVPGERLLAWLGPAIGPQSFEVGGEVRGAFIAHDPAAASAFRAQANGKWLCDIYRLAALRLQALGVCRITSADFDTVRDAERFYSYRRDGVTGRMASLIWLGNPGLTPRAGGDARRTQRSD
ncbi:peptidoglycan editing factor PgeF [Sulfuricystis multivorans]|uniref:peptidoglycan editing factor PgeF n=1 Tax=Sulfuricystis multivorans TaxID=2211108 RepID=UPI000F817062|nr:peptidoglycan editing factor PgeF [Sulfuricystis multivorans]